ncbi:zinc-binding alcohol dehydrogenase family protein [Catellatospora bangladeshensis]|uniref:zinc-binding alcohol dehydrogenase family protein n=1 Tax=Catellatospora bangladeshensis TaxID=310355 RepID=UPI00360F371A
MAAWEVARPGPIAGRPLRAVRRAVPAPADDELLVRVRACAVCRTDLHVAEGDLPPHRSPVIPGHEVVGEVTALGAAVTGWAAGERVGIAWLRHTDGMCAYCRRGQENLCPASRYTGWDADGGYAEYAVVPAEYAYRLPAGYDDAHLAPLLCAGIIGYRALRRAELPPGAAWASTASAPRRTSPRRSPSPRARPCT